MIRPSPASSPPKPTLPRSLGRWPKLIGYIDIENEEFSCENYSVDDISGLFELFDEFILTIYPKWGTKLFSNSVGILDIFNSPFFNKNLSFSGNCFE